MNIDEELEMERGKLLSIDNLNCSYCDSVQTIALHEKGRWCRKCLRKVN
jgi:hypothetical protein